MFLYTINPSRKKKKKTREGKGTKCIKYRFLTLDWGVMVGVSTIRKCDKLWCKQSTWKINHVTHEACDYVLTYSIRQKFQLCVETLNSMNQLLIMFNSWITAVDAKLGTWLKCVPNLAVPKSCGICLHDSLAYFCHVLCTVCQTG